MDILAKYGTQIAIVFPVVKRGVVDLAVSADWTPATGDVKVSKDGGNVANTTNNPAAVGGTGSALWSLTLTATEMQAARVVVQIVDSATKAIEDQVIMIATYGHASAQHAFDLDSATVTPADGSITAAVIATGAVDADAIADGAIDAGAIATGAITSAKFAAGAIDAAAIGTGAIDADALAADAITAAKVAADVGAEFADAVWDEALAGHAGAGSAGKRASDTGSAVDTNLDATVSSRGTADPGDDMGLTAGAITAVQAGLATSAAVAGVQADTDNIQTRLPAALVSGRIDASVGAMAAGVVTATAIADGALTAAKAAAGFFDAVWTRTLASMTSPASLRTPYGMVCKLVNKVAVAAGVLTVYEPDDATAVGTQTVTTDAAAEPITGLDTA